jgi:hypothetical protein
MKYSTSLYTIFKLGDAFALTENEQWFAFMSELVISLIYGALAGVMSTLMMAGSVGEQVGCLIMRPSKRFTRGNFVAQMQICTNLCGCAGVLGEAGTAQGMDESQAPSDARAHADHGLLLCQPPERYLFRRGATQQKHRPVCTIVLDISDARGV